MSNTQIKKPRPYILGGISGIILGVLLLYFLEYFLTAPDQVNLINRQLLGSLFGYVLLVVSFLDILRGVSLAYRQWRYKDELGL